MIKKRILSFALAVTLVAVSLNATRSAGAAVEITFWHAFTGINGKATTDLVTAFNASHPDIHVTEQYKGNYNDTLNAVIQASGQKQGPNIAQIFDLGTPLAIDSGFFTPIESLLTADQLAAVKADVAGPVLSYFTVGGKLNSMPWNNSTPLFYYNKDMFKAAGLDPEKPPATWQDIEADCAKILAANVAPNCISMQVYGWYVEQWMALQGAELANNGNGRAGRATTANLTSDAAKNILNFWKDLNDKKYWPFTGKPEDNQSANQIFIAKQAAMMIESTGALGTFVKGAASSGFQLGTGFMPSNANIDRVGVIIGGASLWVGAGHPDAENQAAVTFILWLLAPEQMAKWHQATGYLPITAGAQKLLTDQGWFTQNPGDKTAIDQLNANKVTSATAGAVMGPFPQIRTLVEQAIIAVVNGSSVDDALNAAKTKADQALADYNNRLGASAGATPAATMAATAAK
ncbi:MAG: ABC transporter substrate-binding protein [Aggregatilineales bacterium]